MTFLGELADVEARLSDPDVYADQARSADLARRHKELEAIVSRSRRLQARTDDLAGLPPAWIGIGAADLFHDEDIAYAERLRAAGVACELHVVEGMYHGADVTRPKAPAIVAFQAGGHDALRAAVGEPPAADGADRP